MLAHSGGSVPFSLLLSRYKCANWVMLDHSGGSVPVRVFTWRKRCVRSERRLHSVGRVPTSLFDCKYRFVSAVKLPHCCGRVPVMLLLDNCISVMSPSVHVTPNQLVLHGATSPHPRWFTQFGPFDAL
jgi:hypothetical protein